MYTDYFNFTARPFQLTPDYRFFFDSRPHRKAIAYLTYGLNQGEGFVVITGGIGTGKTTLIDRLLAEIEEQDIVSAKIVTTSLSGGSLMRMVATAFGLPENNGSKASVINRIEKFLIDQHNAGRRAILFVDEAQNIPDAALEELRMLSNFQIDAHPLLQIFLIGQPEFRQTLARKGLEQLRQRVIASFHLRPLDVDDTRAYIEHRLTRAGWNGDPVFEEGAYRLIFESTGGLPRKINLLCDRLLLFCSLEGNRRITRDSAEEVIRDMHVEG
jgi:putative secretion ATPase (PEP-CTERM system associated)